MPELDFNAILGASCGVTAAVLGQYKPDITAMGPALAAIPAAYGLGKAVMAVKHGGASSVEVVPNPWFVANGHEHEGSPVTQHYLFSRNLKSTAAGMLGIAGAGSAIATGGIDGISAAVHGNAVASTLIHVYKLHNIAGRHRSSKTIADWITLIARMKMLAKAGVRSAQLVGAVVPAASLPLTIISSLASTGIANTVGTVCLACAAEIHWRAFQETRLSVGGAVGPGSQIVYELFARRGATRILGRYDVASLIKEPAGWQAVGDKIMMI